MVLEGRQAQFSFYYWYSRFIYKPVDLCITNVLYSTTLIVIYACNDIAKPTKFDIQVRRKGRQ